MNVENVQMSLYLFQSSLIAWIRVISPCMLFGLYYGLLSTLPIGPSHLISIRSFLLRGNANAFVALSGLMIGQFILFLSIFWSPLYILIIKPHFITLIIVPYMVFYWFRIKDLSDYRIPNASGFWIDSRIFLESFILQIMNPILLPTPVLARLIHLFIFRYSNNGIFLFSSFLGWLIGHILFFHLSRLLVVRIESDSPILYLLLKRIINKTFSIIIYINVLLYLGKAPVPILTHKIEDRIVLFEENFYELPDWTLWMFKQWPTAYFDQYRPNRPMRYVRSRFSGNSPVKSQVSTHFFQKFLSDGKERITLTALPNLSIFENQFQLLEPFKKIEFLTNPYKDWLFDLSIKKESLLNELRDRIKCLDSKFTFSQTTEKRTELTNQNKERLPKPCNPLLSNFYRVQFPTSRSFWILSDLLKPIIDNPKRIDNNEYNNQSNGNYYGYRRIKDWISNWQSSYDKIPFPWETIPPRAEHLFFFMFEDSKDVRVQQIFEEIDLVYEEELLSNWEVTWEQVFDLPIPERTIFFISLHEDCNGFDWIDLLDISSIDSKRPYDSKKRIRSIYNIEELLKELTYTSHLIIDNPFDIVGGTTDIRNRKLKNLGISIEKTISKPKRIIKRFSETPDFRRELIKGSMRSRRRKTLIWKLLQGKAHSPFFLRLLEIPALYHQYAVRGFLNTKRRTINPEQEINKDSEQQRSSSPSVKKNVQILRSLISAKFDVSSIHTGRSLLLVLQSNLRKYVKLPLLITLKNLVRIFLFQSPEWTEDWNECRKESHINCTYDGEEFSDTDLPARWLKEGVQIKIVHPFRFKPWHKHKEKQSILRRSSVNTKDSPTRKSKKRDKLEKERFQATYLTVWGFQTDRPFGTIQREPSFWKPIRRELINTWKNSLSLRTRQLDSLCFKIGIPIRFGSIVRKGLNPLGRFRMTQKNPFQTTVISNNTFVEALYEENTNNGKIKKKSIQINNSSPSFTNIHEKRVADTFNGSEPKVSIYESKNPNLKKMETNQRSTLLPSFINKKEINRILKNRNLTSSLRFKKVLIDFQRRALILRIGIAKSFDNLFTALFFQRIHRIICNSSVTLMTFQIQIIRVIKNIVKNNTNKKESTLTIPNTDQLERRLDNKAIGPLSQAYIYDNLWNTTGTDNLNLTDLMKTLKKSENQEELNKEFDWNDDRQKQESDRYNDFLNNVHPSKQEFSECLENRDDIMQEYFDQSIKDLIIARGLSKQLSDLTVDDWKVWLESFNRYNLPMEVWRKIAPQKWRANAKNLNRSEKEMETDIFKTQDKSISYANCDDFSFYIGNPFLRDRIKNLNKRHRYTYLLSNLVNCIQRKDCEGLNNVIKQKSLGKIRINNLIGRKKRKILNQQIDNLEKELILKTDLAIWIIPDAIKNKNPYKTRVRSRFGPNTCILKKPFFDYPLNEQFGLGIEHESVVRLDEMLLRDRLNHDFLSQWKWKSEALYKRLQRFKDLLSLMNVLQKKQDLAAYISIDPDIVNLLFGNEKIDILGDLFIVSSHRLSRIFDDQILMYKIVSILLKFRNRFRKRLDKDIFDECKPRLCLLDETTNLPYLSNIDDLLLPRKRREAQILGSIGVYKRVKWKEVYHIDSTSQVEEIAKTKKSKHLNQTQEIKRFLWPSHRLEELACINRFYFHTSNGSRFTTLKIRMFPFL